MSEPPPPVLPTPAAVEVKSANATLAGDADVVEAVIVNDIVMSAAVDWWLCPGVDSDSTVTLVDAEDLEAGVVGAVGGRLLTDGVG